MPVSTPALHAAPTSLGDVREVTYRKVVKVPFVPPTESPRVPPNFHPDAAVRCVEGGGSQWNLFDARDIGHFRAQDKYTCFDWRFDGAPKEQLLDESLRRLELRLRGFGFIRVNRQELVNLRFVRQVKLISSSDGARAVLVLHDGTRIAASRRGTRLLKQHLLRMAPAPQAGLGRRRACAGR